MNDLKTKLKSAGLDIESMSPVAWSIDETVYCIPSNTINAMETWQKLRGLFEETSHWPIITDTQETLHRLSEQIETSKPSFFSPEQQRDWPWVGQLPEDWKEWITRGEALSFDSWLETREAEMPIEEDLEKDWNEKAVLPKDPLVLQSTEQHILLFPVQQSWHIPALLRYGNWNDCPATDVHVAATKYWNNHFGAELIALTNDTFEFLCTRPPHTKEETLQLAKKHYFYCSDTANDGIVEWASFVKDAHLWTFWWD